VRTWTALGWPLSPPTNHREVAIEAP
jgi:hypothetical protein